MHAFLRVLFWFSTLIRLLFYKCVSNLWEPNQKSILPKRPWLCFGRSPIVSSGLYGGDIRGEHIGTSPFRTVGTGCSVSSSSRLDILRWGSILTGGLSITPRELAGSPKQGDTVPLLPGDPWWDLGTHKLLWSWRARASALSRQLARFRLHDISQWSREPSTGMGIYLEVHAPLSRLGCTVVRSLFTSLLWMAALAAWGDRQTSLGRRGRRRPLVSCAAPFGWGDNRSEQVDLIIFVNNDKLYSK